MAGEPGELLFCYGTLQNAVVQRAEIGRDLTGSADEIAGFKLAGIAISDPDEAERNGAAWYPALVADAGNSSTISGTLYRLTAEELERADRYETNDYVRQRVRLTSGREAWVYVAAPGLAMEV